MPSKISHLFPPLIPATLPAASAAAAFQIVTEPMLAAAARKPASERWNHDRFQRESAWPQPIRA